METSGTKTILSYHRCICRQSLLGCMEKLFEEKGGDAAFIYDWLVDRVENKIVKEEELPAGN